MSTSTTTDRNLTQRPAESMAERTDQQPIVVPPVDIFESDAELLLSNLDLDD